MLQTKNGNVEEARKFSSTFHFIVGLGAINDKLSLKKKLQRNLMPELLSK